MEIEIRRFQASDEEGTCLVSRDAHATLRRVYRPTKSAKPIGSDDLPFTRLVALSNGELIGTVTYEINGDSLYFGRLGVLETFRKKGVCGVIIKHLETVARDLGFQKLSCAAVEETGNAAIFKKLGFVVVAKDLTDKFESPEGHPVHEVRLEKQLV